MHHDDWFSNSSSLGEFVRLLDENPDAGFAFSGATAKVAESKKSRRVAKNPKKGNSG